MGLYKTPKEIELMSISGQLVADTFKYLKRNIKAGISTLEISLLAEDYIFNRGAYPAFKGYEGFPHTACISVNEEVIHGIPRKDKIIKNGDIVSVDLGVLINGYYGDSAYTYEIGPISKKAKNLINITRISLEKGIEQMYPGNRLSNISYSIQSFAEKNGYNVVRKFVGHGIGTELHEPPQVPNFGKKNKGLRLEAGMVLAIEPMINEGTGDVVVLSDGWTARTKDKKLSAHFEHTIAITEHGPMILTE